MKRTAMGWACWTVCAASLGALTACGGGISIGKDDGKLTSSGTGGAAAKAGSGGAPIANPMHETSGQAGGANAVINAFPDAGTPGASCLPNDEWVDWGGLDGAGCMSGPLPESLRIRGIRVQNSFPGTGVLVAGPADPTKSCDLSGGTTITRFGPGVGEVKFASDALLELPSGTQLTFGIEELSGPQTGSASIKFLLAAADSTAQPVTLSASVSALDYTVVEPGGGAIQTKARAAACNAPWTSLASVAGQLEPGGEVYYCTYKTLPRDVDVGAVRATPAASGVKVLEITAGFIPPGLGNGAEGTLVCDASAAPFPNLVGQFDGSSEVRYADGTAPHIDAGHQIVIMVHVLNRTPEPFDGTFVEVQYQPSAAQ